MLRLTRLTDYGIMLLTCFAREPERVRSARELAQQARLPLPTVSKILKSLAHSGLLTAHRGVKGGFNLARRPEDVNVAEIITALEGPVAITECSDAHGTCRIEPTCIVRANWRKLNRAVYDALRKITLAEMTHPLHIEAAPVEVRRAATLAPSKA